MRKRSVNTLKTTTVAEAPIDFHVLYAALKRRSSTKTWVLRVFPQPATAKPISASSASKVRMNRNRLLRWLAGWLVLSALAWAQAATTNWQN